MAMTTEEKIAFLRLLLDDNTAPYILTDGNYTTILSLEPNLYLAASTAANSIAATFAQSVAIDIKGVSISANQKYEHYKQLSKEFYTKGRVTNLTDSSYASTISSTGNVSPIVTGVKVAEVEAAEEDSTRVSPLFNSKQFDNPDSEIWYRVGTEEE